MGFSMSTGQTHKIESTTTTIYPHSQPGFKFLSPALLVTAQRLEILHHHRPGDYVHPHFRLLAELVALVNVGKVIQDALMYILT